MPFDGVGLPADDKLYKIDAVIELLANPERWCKGALTSHNGRHCIRGAMIAANAIDLEAPVLAAIREVAGKRFRRIESFNDHPATEHAQMLQVLARTRDNIMAGRLGAGLPAKPAGLRARIGSFGSATAGWLKSFW